MKKGILVLIAITAILALGFTAQDAMAVGSVEGAVFDSNREVVEGAPVMLMQTDAGRGERPYRAETETDERGTFGFDEVPAGAYVVTAMTRELGGVRAELRVVDDEVTQVRLVLEGRQQEEDPEVGVVVGIVETPDGDGVAGARIILTPMRRGHRVRPMTTQSDRQGNFVFQEVPEGMYMAQAIVRGGFAMARVEVIADQRNRVTLVLRRIGDRGGEGDRGDRRRERMERFERRLHD
ncbi:MAG: carboxypeptidase regulatory-like domain-containing protein [Calditrichaeota bacterium]|nr:carboxypeptidase regulatory-like domain-containing protein [Calditrichota bacterium]